jgi:arabinogalactan endo-1,4-beta-galactosidase
MKKFLNVLTLAALSMGLFACGGSKEEQKREETKIPEINRTYEKVASDSLYVKKVENMENDFIMGMDMSSVISEEASGVKFYNFKGEESDVFKVVSENGVNYIRVRVWNNPYDKDGHGYGGGNCDINTAIAIGKRATANNMKLLVSFHYSDFWADPAKQMAPKAWENMEIEEKSEALYNYTKESLQKLKDNKIYVGMVSVGNETNGSMCGCSAWSDICELMKAGARASREVYPEAKIAVHFTNPEKQNNMLNYASKLKYYSVDYDIFGTSYYPYWHGTLDNLADTLNKISDDYGKKTMVMETSYAFTSDDSDFWSNTSPSGTDKLDYVISVAGQANHLRNLTDTIANKCKEGIGFFYWESAWITVGKTSFEANSAKWEKYGSGWASSYAKDYDPKDAGKWYGGSAVDNQALFDSDGKPLESLKVFNLVRFGNEAPEYVDGAEDITLIKYTTDDFTLPETVNVVYNTNERKPVPVTWEEFSIEDAKAKGNAKYDIKGKAAGYDVVLHLQMMEKNFIENYSFEDGIKNWTVTNNGGTLNPDSYKAEVTNENPYTGKSAFHFWTTQENTVNVDVEQELKGLSSGFYKYQVSIMGGGKGTAQANAEKQNHYAYVKINDEIVYKKNGLCTVYADWADIKLDNIEVKNGDKVVVGIHIETSEANAWGDVDDCMFNYLGK